MRTLALWKGFKNPFLKITRRMLVICYILSCIFVHIYSWHIDAQGLPMQCVYQCIKARMNTLFVQLSCLFLNPVQVISAKGQSRQRPFPFVKEHILKGPGDSKITPVRLLYFTA